MSTPCAQLEATGQLQAALTCYVREVVREPRSSSSSCGALRSARLMQRDADSGDRVAAQTLRKALRSLRGANLIAEPPQSGAARCVSALARELQGWRATRLRPKKRAKRGHPLALRKRAEGEALARSGNMEAAAQTLRDALEIDPELAEARAWLGICESRLGRSSVALAELAAAEASLLSARDGRRGTDQGPDTRELSSLASFERATLLFAHSRLDEAALGFRRALAARPTYGEAMSNLGVIAYMSDRIEEAVARFTEATVLQPRFADAYQYLGAAYKSLGAAEAAHAAYVSSSRLAPSATEPLRGVNLVLRERGRLQEARRALRTALKLEPTGAQVRTCIVLPRPRRRVSAAM